MEKNNGSFSLSNPSAFFMQFQKFEFEEKDGEPFGRQKTNKKPFIYSYPSKIFKEVEKGRKML